jgi:hypothetical protein
VVALFRHYNNCMPKLAYSGCRTVARTVAVREKALCDSCNELRGEPPSP